MSVPRPEPPAPPRAARPGWPRPGECRPEPDRLAAADLRSALQRLADSPEFLRSEAGACFLWQLEQYLAPSLLAQARRVGLGPNWLQPHEVVHTVLLELCAEQGRVARRIAATARDPWGYLARCASPWLHALWGTRGISLTALPTAAVCLPDPVAATTETGLTPLTQVIARTHATLTHYTAADLRAPLRELLCWLAQNPPQRPSHDGEDRLAAQQHCPAFTAAQIAAVANICWGVRPRRQDTSLMAAFLLDGEFCPAESPSHARALLRYRRAMRARGLSIPQQVPQAQPR